MVYIFFINTFQTGSEKTEDEAKSTAPEGAESPDSSTNKKTGTPADQEAKPQSLEDETTNQEAGPQEETANEDAVNQSVDMTVAETEVVDEEPTEASEVCLGSRTREIIFQVTGPTTDNIPCHIFFLENFPWSAMINVGWVNCFSTVLYYWQRVSF